MRILVLHNYYLQPGGEDVVFQSETKLLRQNGHFVSEYTENNARIPKIGKVDLAVQTIWSKKTYDNMLVLLDRERPDIVHFHNTFPLISASAYDACKEKRVPIIQTLHNFRLLCPAATLFRDDNICEDCIGKTHLLPSIKHACYHGSRLQTSVLAIMLSLHRWKGTWENKVDLYIALTEFSRRKFIEGDLPEQKLIVKPNFVTDPGSRNGYTTGALFIGRLSHEKGIMVLLQSWNSIPEVPIDIIGDGPLANKVKEFEKDFGNVGFRTLGRYSRPDALSAMKNASFLVFPSSWYEGFPVTLVEAFACGLPVVASRLGGIAEIIDDGVTGLLFTPGDPIDLASKVRWAWEHPKEMAIMGENARKEYEIKYTPERNYHLLMGIYQRAIGNTK